VRTTSDRQAIPDADGLAAALIERDPTARARRDDVRVVRAPGRVNLIGEHTDYNEGFVLPAAIDLEIRIAYVPAHDGRVELTRLDDNERDSFELTEDRPRGGTWLDYVAGTAWALREAGLEPHGLRGVIASNLPANAGLSSSAAIELASAWAMLGDAARDVDPLDLARICQRAENGYVGVQSGLMDQFAEACGTAGAQANATPIRSRTAIGSWSTCTRTRALRMTAVYRRRSYSSTRRPKALAQSRSPTTTSSRARARSSSSPADATSSSSPAKR